MPPAFQTDSDCVVDRAAHTIRLVRDLNAAPALVFEAWTKPEHISVWWDATGAPLASCEMDVRPGGSFTFVSSSNPDHIFTGIYIEVAPPHRLVFDANGAEGRLILAANGEGTRMTVEIDCKTAEMLDHYLAMGVETGTSQTLANLKAYLADREATAA
jgi:uncharacterized protein YndB with AHSA1/START domain